MTREQAGCVRSYDKRQKKRDDRLLKEEKTKDAKATETLIVKNKLMKNKAEYEKENIDQALDENVNDKDFMIKEGKKGKDKIDVMGKIALTCDALNSRDRTVISASVANALGVDIDKTNINQTSAWRKGQKARLEKSADILKNFDLADMVVVHWDGKTLKLRGRIESKRVCIFISGVDAEKTRKLLEFQK